ncbi:hypothetical protein PBI_OMNICRON_75 [Mycobacterium phage Omnicron]|uniref:Uncharacterized protein n=1 Tax=Mycobacterium phage Omnicron TaxID=1541819 RepID=A0A088FQI2_9CAUD|nr:hypothetical protein PBI_OMNICRON_75 [Mycobacterium phage Omnicron]AIM50408.1 hypothetical protein PBI_OMNICRON_75 [Mycobacterium phage Omnicron]
MTAPNYRHARDIPDTVFLHAVFAGQRARRGAAMRQDVTRLLGGLPVDAHVAADEVPGVPWKVVLAKFRRVKGRGLVGGCDCSCRGDWELTPKGQRILLLSVILNTVVWCAE